jgi:hypothetical protein
MHTRRIVDYELSSFEQGVVNALKFCVKCRSHRRAVSFSKPVIAFAVEVRIEQGAQQYCN